MKIAKKIKNYDFYFYIFYQKILDLTISRCQFLFAVRMLVRNEEEKMSLNILLFPILIPAFLLAVLTGCSKNEVQQKPEEKVLVETFEAVRKEIAIPVHSSGKLSEKVQVKLSFKTGGIAKDVLVEEGQRVEKGQLLAQLDLSEINAQVDQARAGYEKALRDLARVKKLYDENVTTLEQLQNATTALEIAESQVRVAKFNLQHSSIFAPSGGKILKRFVEPGELVGSGTPIFIFGSDEHGWIVQLGVIDRDIIRLRPGDAASVRFDAYPGTSFSAHVSEIAETADPMTGTFEVEVTLDRNDHKLVSGFIAKVDILPSKLEPFYVIPVESLVEGDGMTGFVYTLEKDRGVARKVGVKIGHIFDREIAVSSGLRDGDNVIVKGTEYLSDGTRVKTALK
jgi:multidrug efflux system membrane fusion protein